MKVIHAGETYPTAKALESKLAKADTRKWCWSESSNSESWYGPFDTRDAAIADANALTDEVYTEIIISRCNYAVPAESAMAWAETMDPLESLHENTDNELQNYDGETFGYINGADAERELSDLLAAWAEKHVKVSWFCCDGDAIETVERSTLGGAK
jgi:hypothetical protein